MNQISFNFCIAQRPASWLDQFSKHYDVATSQLLTALIDINCIKHCVNSEALQIDGRGEVLEHRGEVLVLETEKCRVVVEELGHPRRRAPRVVQADTGQAGTSRPLDQQSC